MDLRAFFENDFFVAIIAITAFLALIAYLDAARFKISYYLYRRLMLRRISKLHDHFIVLGYGRVGTHIVKELEAEKVPFVVIDKDPLKIEKCKEKRYLCLEGDVAASDKLLKIANIEEARAVIIAFGNDADNIAAAISVKALRDDVFTVARANEQESVDKLVKLGIDRIVQPHQIGGYHMATYALRPGVIDLLDVVIDSNRLDLQIEELSVGRTAKIVGKKIAEIFGLSLPLLLLAVRAEGGSLVVLPKKDYEIKANDKLIVMGSSEILEGFSKEWL
jgi:voltage-gated potassium channel